MICVGGYLVWLFSFWFFIEKIDLKGTEKRLDVRKVVDPGWLCAIDFLAGRNKTTLVDGLSTSQS
jgi:hypothetical protein